MTLADKLDRAWRTLEAGESKEGLVRSLADIGIRESSMLLGIDDGCRELLFPATEDFKLDNLHRTRGVKVLIRMLATGKSRQRHLVLRCTRPEFHLVFRRFAAAVVEQVSDSELPARAALEAIRGWQEMFNRAGAKSETVLCGLYGELHELRGLVERSTTALSAWTGPYGRPQDFTRGPCALEVKSTRTLTSAVEIHGLEQLWAAPYEELVLVVKQVVTDAAGERLIDIATSLVNAGVSVEALYEHLEACDLDEQALAALDTPRFAHRGSRYFLVRKSAAVLTPDHLRAPLSPAVSRLQYRLSLDAPGLEAMAPSDVNAFLARMCG